MINLLSEWYPIAILVSALAALIAALATIYQGRKMQRAVEIDHAISRPFIVIKPKVQPTDLSTIELQAKNTGNLPARILYDSGKTWLSGKPTRTNIDEKSLHVLYPKETTVLAQITLDDPERVKNGQIELKIGYSLLFENVNPKDQRRWICDSWFYFNPDNAKLEIKKRDEMEKSKLTKTCKIDELMPKNWLKDIKKEQI